MIKLIVFVQQQKFFIVNNCSERTNEIMAKKDLEDENYLESRPKIFWENIRPLKQNGEEAKFLFIMLVDRHLEEEYIYGFKDNLIYWFAWNINKDDYDIPALKRLEVKKEGLGTNIKQFYHYKIFDPNKLQLPKYDSNNDIRNIKINKSLGVDRMAKLKFKYCYLSENENNKLKEIYDNLKNDNFSNLYYNFFKELKNPNSIYIMNDFRNNIEDCEDKDNINLHYSMLGKSNMIKYKKYLEQDSIYKNGLIRLFSFNDITYDIKNKNSINIELPKNTYWKLIFTNFNDKTLFVKIRGIESCIINKEHNYYYIPYKTDNFDILIEYNNSEECDITDYLIIKESKYVTKSFVWKDVLKNQKY